MGLGEMGSQRDVYREIGSRQDGFREMGLWFDEVASKAKRRNEAKDNTEREETQRTNETERGETKQRGEMEKNKVKRKKVIWFWHYQCSHILVFGGAKNSNIVF